MNTDDQLTDPPLHLDLLQFQTIFSPTDMELIPLELMHSSRDTIRKAREAYLIDRGQTLEPKGINKHEEM